MRQLKSKEEDSDFTQVAGSGLERMSTDTHYGYWVVVWPYASLLQGGSALLVLEDLALTHDY